MSNLTIRHVEPEDYQDLQALMACASVVWGTLQMPYPSVRLWKERAATPLEGHYRLVAELAGTVVGMIGLHPESRPRRNHAAHIGMSVHDAHQGQGVGQALLEAAINIADGWLNLRRLELTVFTDNDQAIALYERLGFEREGVLREFAFRGGSYVDALTMARLRVPA